MALHPPTENEVDRTDHEIALVERGGDHFFGSGHSRAKFRDRRIDTRVEGRSTDVWRAAVHER